MALRLRIGDMVCWADKTRPRSSPLCVCWGSVLNSDDYMVVVLTSSGVLLKLASEVYRSEDACRKGETNG